MDRPRFTNSKSKAPAVPEKIEEKSSQSTRVPLHRVVLDSTALLNIVKHCREADWK